MQYGGFGTVIVKVRVGEVARWQVGELKGSRFWIKGLSEASDGTFVAGAKACLGLLDPY